MARAPACFESFYSKKRTNKIFSTRVLGTTRILKNFSFRIYQEMKKDQGYLPPPFGKKLEKVKKRRLVMYFEIFLKKAPKNRRPRRAFKFKQTHNIFMKGLLAHLKNLIPVCTNKKGFEL